MVQWYSTAGASAQPHLIHVSLGPPESTTQMASQSVQPFLHSSRQTVVGHAQGDLDPHQVHGSLGPSESTSQTAFRSVQPFLHSSRHSDPIVYNRPPFTLSIAPSLLGGSGPTSNAFCTHPSPQAKRHLHRLSRSCRAPYCDRQTDRPRFCESVTIHHRIATIRIRIDAAMWPKNEPCAMYCRAKKSYIVGNCTGAKLKK